MGAEAAVVETLVTSGIFGTPAEVVEGHVEEVGEGDENAGGRIALPILVVLILCYGNTGRTGRCALRNAIGLSKSLKGFGNRHAITTK